MNTLKHALKQRMPPYAWYAASTVYGMQRRLLSPHGIRSMLRIRRLKDRHRGERCFILGNGPSLQQTNLALLRNEYTFGMNRIYLLFAELGFTTTYYVSVNPYVVEQCAEDIAALVLPKFLPWSCRHSIPFDRQTMLLQSSQLPHFSFDPALWIWEGNTVTFVALQLAYYMGFQQVILIGVDHSFATKGTPHSLVVSEGDDPDHFAGNYFGRGFRWQLPDLAGSEQAYMLAREKFAAAGRTVLDATVGGKLRVFPKTPYESLFDR
jgi:hypothetical protein